MNQQPRRVIRRNETANPYWPDIRDLPYRYLTVVTLFGAGGFMVALAWLVTDDIVLSLVAGMALGGIVTAVAVNVFLNHALRRIYTHNYTEEESEYSGATVEPARITHNGKTAVIHQPQAGAFAQWAREALENSTVYFSKNQADKRHFDYNEVIGQLRMIGVLHVNANGDGVYTLTDAGRAVLARWLEGE